MNPNPHLGSSFDDFLKEEGTYEETTLLAIKRVLAWQLEQAMKEQGLTKPKGSPLRRMKKGIGQ
jgi:antitoxin HicB